MKRLLALAMAVIMAVSLTACGGGKEEPAADDKGGSAPAGTAAGDSDTKDASSGGKVELQLLRLGDLTKAEPIFAPIVEQFEKDNPDVTVKFDAMAWTEATTKLKLLGAQGELPDVTFINIANGWDLASEGYLSDLSGLVKNDPNLSKDIPQSVIDIATTSDGKMYWVPSATGAFGLWYNKELFEQAGLDPNEPPATMEEMIADAKTITEKTGVPGLGFGVKAMEDYANVIESFYSSYTGVDIWDDGNKCFSFEKDENNRKLFGDCLSEIYKIVNEYGIIQPNPEEYNPYALRTMFRDGQIAMYIDGVWAVKELLDELDKGEDSKFMTALFPAGPAGSHPIMGCDGWAIPSECKNPDEAWKLVQCLMSSDNQTRHATMWGLLPILESEKGKEEFADPYWGPLSEQLQTVAARPKDKQVAMIEQAIADGAQAAALGKMTPDEAMDFMISTVTSNYSE